MRTIQLYLFIIFFSFSFSQTDSILVKIKDKVITKDEFVKRAEYANLPSYCKNDQPFHKNIILNSLISEKLMAIDIESDVNNDNFSSDFLNGIKEQKMREVLLNEEVYNKALIDSSLFNIHKNNSNRLYELNFISIDNDTLAAIVQNYLRDGINFDNICYNYLNLQSIPSRSLGYFDEPDIKIHNEIFSKNLKINDVLGPIISSDNKFLFLKVLSWTDLTMDFENNKNNYEDLIIEKMTMYENYKNYSIYMTEAMDGNKLKFIEKPFLKLANISYDYYFNKENFNDEVYNDNSFNIIYFANQVSIDKDDNLIMYNDNALSISDLHKLISKHPLLFSLEEINKDQFPLYFQYAMVELLRDEKLNQLAYLKGYDSHTDVITEYQMFYDATLSQLHLKSVLEKNGIAIEVLDENPQSIFDKFLDNYIESLREKYNNDINIDWKLFNSLSLKNDMDIYRRGMPYPKLVPAFPVLTSKITVLD